MAKKITLDELGDMLAHVVKHMATKEDLYEVRLDNLEEKVFGAPRR